MKTIIKAIEDNYNTLFNLYIKYKDVMLIKQGRTCEDIFNDKILLFLELNTDNLTLIQEEQKTIDQFQSFLHTNQSRKRQVCINEYIDGLLYDNYISEYEEREADKIKYLFIDYQTNNIKK